MTEIPFFIFNFRERVYMSNLNLCNFWFENLKKHQNCKRKEREKEHAKIKPNKYIAFVISLPQFVFALVFAFVFSILMGICVNAMANADANFHLFVIVKVCWCLVIFCFSSTLSTKFAFVFQIFALYFTNQIYFFSLLFSFYLVAPFFFVFWYFWSGYLLQADGGVYSSKSKT